MSYVRKTRDVWEVQGHRDPAYGFQTVAKGGTRKEGIDLLRFYRENDPGTVYCLKITWEPL
jgi:hypothetical protein